MQVLVQRNDLKGDFRDKKKSPEHFLRGHGPGPLWKALIVTIYPRSVPVNFIVK